MQDRPFTGTFDLPMSPPRFSSAVRNCPASSNGYQPRIHANARDSTPYSFSSFAFIRVHLRFPYPHVPYVPARSRQRIHQRNMRNPQNSDICSMVNDALRQVMLEFLDALVGDVAVVESHPLELPQALKMHESGIGNLSVVESQPLDLTQSSEMY
jgi:hypothetical protein